MSIISSTRSLVPVSLTIKFRIKLLFMTENLCQWEFCFPSFESPCYFGWSKTFNDPVIGNASAWGLLTFIIILFYQVFCCKMCNQSRQHPHQWQRSVNWLLFKLQKTLETPVFILYLVFWPSRYDWDWRNARKQFCHIIGTDILVNLVFIRSYFQVCF